MANYKEKQKDNFKSNGASKSPEIKTLKGENWTQKEHRKSNGRQGNKGKNERRGTAR